MVMSDGTYDLIFVRINEELVQGRPIEWDRVPVDIMGHDNVGELMKPTKYMTTCPYCAQLIKFGVKDMMKGDHPEHKDVACAECGAQSPSAIPVEDPVPPSEPEKPKPKHKAPTVDPFVDPVENQLVATDNYVL
jgi:hypothetical protein